MSKKKNWELDRRAFLKCSLGGASVMLGLPFLEVMMPSSARAQTTGGATRFFAIQTGCGPNVGSFYPREYLIDALNGNFDGAQSKLYPLTMTTMTYALSPLKKYLNHLNVFAGVSYAEHREELHHGNVPRTFTGISPIKSGDSFNLDIHPNFKNAASPYNGRSIDLIIADHLKQVLNDSKFPIIHFNNQNYDMDSKCDKPSYRKWDDPILRLSPSDFRPATQRLEDFRWTDLNFVYGQLFKGTNNAAFEEAIYNVKKYKKSMIDLVWEDAKSLRNKLPSNDKIILDRHIEELFKLGESVSNIDNDKEEKSTCTDSPIGTFSSEWSKIKISQSGTQGQSTNDNASYINHMRLTFDLIFAAFQCNATRVASYTLETTPTHHPIHSSYRWGPLAEQVKANPKSFNDLGILALFGESRTHLEGYFKNAFNGDIATESFFRNAKNIDGTLRYPGGDLEKILITAGFDYHHNIHGDDAPIFGIKNIDREKFNSLLHEEWDHIRMLELNRLVEKLASTQEGDKTALDNTLIYFASSYGNNAKNRTSGVSKDYFDHNHAPTGIHCMLIGGGGGVKGGKVHGLGGIRNAERGPRSARSSKSVIKVLVEIAKAFGKNLDIDKYAVANLEDPTGAHKNYRDYKLNIF
jgi:hypothetical protein